VFGEIDGQVYSEGGIDWESDIQDYHGMRLDKIFTEGRTSFLYEYDPGDSWRHDITLLGTVAGEPGEKIACIGGARACPPEDCGGTPQDTMTYWRLFQTQATRSTMPCWNGWAASTTLALLM